MSASEDTREKARFLEAVMDAVVDAGYPDPGFYIDDYAGEPAIFSADETPIRSVAGDSPIGILRDLVKVLDQVNY